MPAEPAIGGEMQLGLTWGSDAFTPLALLAAHTERIRRRRAARSIDEVRQAVELVKG